MDQQGCDVRFVPKADISLSLDHVVGTGEERRRNGHKNPVATPSRNEGSIAASCAPTELESFAPKFTNGRMARSARLGKMSANPKAARTTTAMVRPYWFAST